jgi:hypothetical protein
MVSSAEPTVPLKETPTLGVTQRPVGIIVRRLPMWTTTETLVPARAKEKAPHTNASFRPDRIRTAVFKKGNSQLREKIKNVSFLKKKKN